jgi:H+/Cl- antiporter ClcA
MNETERQKTLEGMLHIPNLKLKLAFEGILVGVATGFCIILLRLCLGFVAKNRSRMVHFLQNVPPSYALIWVACLLLAAVVIALLVRWAPIAGGSGIPQVRGIVLGLEKSAHWARVILVKLIDTSLGIGAGLSMGREGPSVQIGAMTGQGVGNALNNTNLEKRALISSGAGAGLAAAFNAPMAGVMFTMEAIHKNLSSMVMVPTLMACMTTTVMVHWFFGMDTVLTFPQMPFLPLELLPHLIFLGLFSGFLGVAFNKGSLGIGKFYSLPLFRKDWMKIAFPLLLTIPLTYFLPQVLGAGDGVIEAMISLKGTLSMILVVLLGKFLFTILSTGSGAPGGSLQPMLVLGSLCGALYGNVMVQLGLLPETYRLNMVMLGMAGWFAGSVRAPVTAILLLLEMTGRFYHLVPLGIVTLFAYAAGELVHDTPIFDAMLERALAKNPRAKDLVEAPTDQMLVEIAVEGGSPVEGKSLRDIRLPGRALVVCVRRGDADIIPQANTVLMGGDYVYLIPNHAHLHQLNQLFKTRNETV